MSEEDVIKLKNDFREVMSDFLSDMVKPEVLYLYSEENLRSGYFPFVIKDISLGDRLDLNDYNNTLYPHFDIIYKGYIDEWGRINVGKEIITRTKKFFPNIVLSERASFRFIKYSSNINESIPKKSIINQMVVTMDYKEEDAKDELESMIEWLNSLPNELELYRIVFVDSEEEINLKEPGAHYAMDKEQLLSSHSWLDGYGDKKFLITVIAKKSMIKKSTTLMVRAIFPHENEILLKNNGKGVKIVSVEEIK